MTRPFLIPRIQIGDVCTKGHVIEGDNIATQKKNGEDFYRCRTCRNEWYRERRASKRTVERKVKLTKRQAQSQLQEALVNEEPNCKDRPTRYTDYEEDLPPSVYVAEVLCRGCPIMDSCKAFAYAEKPYMGVWGGEVWIQGKVRQ